MNTSNIITKRRKTQKKVASFIQLNEQIISKYGSFDNLRSQRTLFTRGRLEEHRDASKDYRNYLKRKKFIENNFDAAQVPLSSSSNNRIDATNNTMVNGGGNDELLRPQQDREDENNPADEENNDNNIEINQQPDSNDVLLDENRKLRDDNTENVCCSNCCRRQCNDLIERYGEMYRLVLYRYVILI